MSDPVDFRREKAKRVTRNDEWSVEDCLLDALEDVRSGKREANAVLVLFLDNGDERYDTAWQAANLRGSESIALMEVVKTTILRGMELT